MPKATAPVSPESIRRNLETVRGRIAESARTSGRAAETVRLVAVTKYVTDADVAALLALGQREFGESRIQDCEARIKACTQPDARWHLIGHLQTNKADKAAKLFQCVQSVDSDRVAAAIQKERAKQPQAAPLDVLLELNAAREPQKYGLLPEMDELQRVLALCATFPLLRVRGLMCMAPQSERPEESSRPVFATLRELQDKLNAKGVYPHPLTELSMGMTQDYTIGIEEGATIVRIGSALFEP